MGRVTSVGLVRSPAAPIISASSIGGQAVPPPTPVRPLGPEPLRRMETRARAPLPTDMWPPRPPTTPDTARRTAGHNLLWMAAMGAFPLLPEVAAALAEAPRRPAPASTPAGAAQPRPRRWSGDSWVLWRPGSQAPAGAGPIAPAYGRSQAGAVFRYDLAPRSPLRPSAYVRAVHALDGQGQGDLAAGLAFRPLAASPITAHGEARLSRRGSVLTLRPAAFLSGGVEAVRLAAGITARGYAQAGYVGGRDATAFADGSLVAEKPLWRDRDGVLTAGAGAWGGAQRGAGRIDLGPTASLRFRLGQATARLSADYRLRIAGNAEPAAGAALTLSAGF